MSESKRQLKTIRNHPGIYKIWLCSKKADRWIDTGKFLAARTLDSSKREKAVFESLKEAIQFRAGNLRKPLREIALATESPHKQSMIFSQLVQEWKSFHFLKIELGTRKLYERKIRHFRFLNDLPVEEIQVSTMDALVKFWMTEYPIRKGRMNFREELKILTTIFKFYQRRKNRSYLPPIEREHFEAATIVKRPKNEVKVLTRDDLFRFLEALRSHSNLNYFPLALTQFCLGLRIGEACGLDWDSVNFEDRSVKIQKVVIWDDRTWQPSIKEYPKNQSIRFLYMPEFLALELQRLKSQKTLFQTNLIFHSKGQPLNRRIIGQAYNAVLKSLGIDSVTGTHFLRRTFATIANELTGDFYAVSKVLDHSSTDVTQRYVKPLLSQKKKVAEIINQALLLPSGL